jgi:hypothetical protein
MRARGGTRTAFRPPQTLGTRGNMWDSARSDPDTTQSDGYGVHIVHTPKFALLNTPNGNRAPPLRERGMSACWKHCDAVRSPPSHVVGKASCIGGSAKWLAQTANNQPSCEDTSFTHLMSLCARTHMTRPKRFCHPASQQDRCQLCRTRAAGTYRSPRPGGAAEPTTERQTRLADGGILTRTVPRTNRTKRGLSASE